ncbi:MAG: response regulator transcription factor [Acidobacteriota bacterium]
MPTRPSQRAAAVVRVLLVDDHSIVRQGLASLLLDAEGIEVVGEASDGDDAVQATRLLRPDVILMDLVMPGLDGVAATAEIRARHPSARILVLSGSSVRERILAAVRAGAAGYISKTAPKQELVDAIRRVHRGQRSMPAALTASLLERYPPAQLQVEPLTRREREILVLVAKGLSNRDVADHAGISEATTRTHVGRIFGKLGVNNRVEATLCALRDGLTTLDECLGLERSELDRDA